MKRFFIIAIIIMAVLSMAVTVVFAVQHLEKKKNEDNLTNLMGEFSQTIENATDGGIIESRSTYGKLNGNGNGIQYFGVVLVHKDSIKDIESLIQELDKKFELVEYWEQEGNSITSKYLEHQKLEYKTAVNSDDEYISICFFNSKHSESDLSDIKGH